MNKKFLLIIPILAALFVFIGTQRTHYYPFKDSIELDQYNVLDIIDTDNGLVAIYDKELLFATPDRKLVKIMSTDINGVESQPRAVVTDGEYVYAIVGEVYSDYNYYINEKLLKYTFSGKYLGELYRKEYGENAFVNSNNLTNAVFHDGYAYLTDTDDHSISLIKVSTTPPKENDETEFSIIDSFRAPEYIQTGRYNMVENRLELFNRFGECYYYDLNEHKLDFHPETIYNKFDNHIPYVSITFSTFTKVTDILYYLGAIILIITVLCAIIKFVTSGYLNRYRTALLFILVFLSAIIYYTNLTLSDFDEEHKLRTISATESVMVGIRYFASDEFEVMRGKNPEDYKDDASRNWIEWMVHYLQAACNATGKEMGMYAQIYAFDQNGTAFLVADSYNEYPVGTLYSDLAISSESEPDESNMMVYTVEKEVDGTYGFIHAPIYDKDHNLIGFLEMGSEYGKLRHDKIRKVIGAAMQLAALVVFLVILLDVLKKYSKELKEYATIRKTNPQEAKYYLSNTYDFLVTGLVYMDSMLMVMAIASIKTDSTLDLALLFAIPVTAYRVGSWVGSMLTSPLLGRFGEKRMGVISSIISAMTFAGIAFAIWQNNIYIFAACKFIEGIFLESVLYSLAEGIPYEIEDLEYRNKKIAESQSATEAASLIYMMIAGIIATTFGYAMMYLTGVVVCIILIPFSYIIFGNEEEDEEIKTLHVWKSFAKPKALIYIILMVLTVSFMTGYDEYLFPLISENAGLTDIEMTSIAVFSITVGYFAESIVKLFNKVSPLKAMITSFSVFGVAMMILLLNPNILFATIVLFIYCITIRIIEVHRINWLIGLTADDNVEGKDVLENYFALEDGFKVLHGPILGPLCAISTSVGIGFLGLLCLVSPRLYSFIAPDLKINNSDEEG
ncbi:MFS transporter [Butyrivibrio sp. FC2001]|uniref:MFS transporter n=1 Tax=Butyrivibrio sp. FC2001 TaxID=1280671 RepID=UPI00040D488C|nr:MFS transporter [Butyrivibrio sp. FC2001]